MATLLALLAPSPALVWADDAGDVGNGELMLARVQQAPTEVGIDGTLHSTPEAAVDPANGDVSTSPSTATPLASPSDTASNADPAITGSKAALTKRQARLIMQRTAAQDRLMSLERARDNAESRLDAALEAYAAHLGTLFDAGANDRLAALMAAHHEGNPTTRTADLAALAAPDRLLLQREDAGRALVARATADADAQRAIVLQLGTTIDAIGQVLSGRVATAQAAHAAQADAVDANLVFASGPIPGIGYWGAVSGSGGMLGGLSSYVSAALGGVGCAPPTPDLRATGRIEQGEASWYGPKFDGFATANGEIYDQEALTAAHPSLPFGTIVRVSSSLTGQCVFLRINDRGPFIAGRIIDLSHAGATAIGMTGTAPVQVEVWASARDTAVAAAPAAPIPLGS